MKNLFRYRKTVIFSIIILLLYCLMSLFIFRGELTPIHYYSYDSLTEAKSKGGLVSNNLKMDVIGDSLKKVYSLEKKFYTTKSMYEKYYGFLIYVKQEDKNLRRIKWEETIEASGKRNWIILNNNEYVGAAFYSGFVDAKIGDTVKLRIKNRKTDTDIGVIKIYVN